MTSDEKYYKWNFLQENINIDDPVKAAFYPLISLKGLNLFNLEAEGIRKGYEELSGKFVKPDYLEWIFDRENSSKNIKVQSLSGLDKIISALYKANKTIKIVSPYMVLTNRMKNALAYAMEKNVEVEFITNGFENSMLFLNDLMHAGYIYDRREYCHLGLKMRERLEESGRGHPCKSRVHRRKNCFYFK